MINLSEKDKEYIAQSTGSYSRRGAVDILITIERKYGSDKRKQVEDEMLSLGINTNDFNKSTTIPLEHFITLLVAKREVLGLSDEEVVLFGKEVAKLSFVLKFASRLLVSVEMICNNANAGWRKYYDTGTLSVGELDKKEGRIVGEVSNFVGHPVHCRYMEGYFSQIMFFVVGKETTCKEVECVFEGGKSHRYIMEWDVN